MDRPGATALFGGHRDLADVLPTPDDLGGCGRFRLRHARSRRRLRGRREGHRRRQEMAARAWPHELIARRTSEMALPLPAITFLAADGNAIDLPAYYQHIH